MSITKETVNNKYWQGGTLLMKMEMIHVAVTDTVNMEINTEVPQKVKNTLS